MKDINFKAIAKAFKLFGFSISPTIRFVYLNFISNRIIRQGGYLYVYPNTLLHINKGAQIVLYGDMLVGIPAIKGSKTNSRLVMQTSSCIEVKKRFELLEGCDIQMQKGGHLTVGLFHSNIGLEISCGSTITIQEEVIAGRHVRIKDFNGHEVSYDGYPVSAPITICNHTWLCTGCTINPGVIVGEGSVIADNSNVISDTSPHSFNQGNPSAMIVDNVTFKI